MRKRQPSRAEATAENIPLGPASGPPDVLEPVEPLMEQVAGVAIALLPWAEADDSALAIRLYLETHPAMRERLRLLATAGADASGPLAIGAVEDSKAGSGG